MCNVMRDCVGVNMTMMVSQFVSVLTVRIKQALVFCQEICVLAELTQTAPALPFEGRPAAARLFT